MKKLYIYIFSISVFCLFVSQANAQQDTISYKQRYGLMVNTDLIKLGRTAFEENYRGFEVGADFRLTEKIWLSGELGADDYLFDEGNLMVNTTGAYFKAGGIYNFHTNWIGMDNFLFGGVRAGFATFSHTLEEFTVTVRDGFFPPDIRTPGTSFNNLNATWIEFMAGARAEVFKNFYLGLNIQLKFITTQSDLNNFDNLFVPGYNITNDTSSFGFGFGYTIHYLFPLYSKTLKQAVDN